MAAISIKDLQVGFDLISDRETYLNELTDEGNAAISGLTFIATVVIFTSSTTASYAVSRFLKTFF